MKIINRTNIKAVESDIPLLRASLNIKYATRAMINKIEIISMNSDRPNAPNIGLYFLIVI